MKDEAEDWFKKLTKAQQKKIHSELRDSVVYFSSRQQTDPKLWFKTLPPEYKDQVYNTYHHIYMKKSKEEKNNGSNRISREHGNTVD